MLQSEIRYLIEMKIFEILYGHFCTIVQGQSRPFLTTNGGEIVFCTQTNHEIRRNREEI